MSHNEDPSRTNGNRSTKVAKILAPLAPLLIAATCSSGEKTDRPHTQPSRVTTSISTPNTTTTSLEASTTIPETVSSEARKHAKQTVKPAAVKSSLQLLDILDKPGSGAEEYDHFYIGNKTAKVGPDEQTGTPDDSAYESFPEIFTNFNPTSGEIYIQAANQDSVTQRTWTTTTSFQVQPNSALFTQSEQFTTADIRQAILDPTTELISASAKANGDSAGNGTQHGLSFSGKYISTGLGMGTVGDVRVNDDLTLATEANSLVNLLDTTQAYFSTAGQ